jgi:hypothetical protein
MVRTLRRYLPLKTARSTVHLEEVVEFSAVVYRDRWRGKQAAILREKDERFWGLVGSKSGMVRKVRLCLVVVWSFVVAGMVSLSHSPLYLNHSCTQKPQNLMRVAYPEIIDPGPDKKYRTPLDMYAWDQFGDENRCDRSATAVSGSPWVCENE